LRSPETPANQPKIDRARGRVLALEAENARLKASVAAGAARRQEAGRALADSEERYRPLFNSIDEGFCVIEFLDGPHGPLSDYVHVEANPPCERHAGIPDVAGRWLREMVPAELYGGVLRTGESASSVGSSRPATISHSPSAPNRKAAARSRCCRGHHRAQARRAGMRAPTTPFAVETFAARVRDMIEENKQGLIHQSSAVHAIPAIMAVMGPARATRHLDIQCACCSIKGDTQ
jgi:hypothetical protein